MERILIISWLIPLQIIFEDLFPQTGDALSGVETVTPFLPYIGAAVLIFFGWLGLRVYKNFSAYPNDEERIGIVNFVWMGHYRFRGNVSRWTEPIDETTLEFLESDPKYADGISKIVDLIHKKKLFIYQMKIAEWDDAFDIKGNKEPWVIITTADIGNPDYAWEDTKGEFNWGTMRKEKPKYVILYEDSKYVPTTNVEGNIVDVVIGSPLPRRTLGDSGMNTFGLDENEIHMVSHTLKVEKLQEMKALATIIPYLIPLAETTELVKSKNIQVREYRKLVEDRDSIINKLQRDNDETRILAAEKPIIGEEAPEPPEPPGHPWVWFAGFIIATLIGYRLPENIAALRDMNQELSALLVALVVGVAYALTHRNTYKQETSLVET